MSKDNLYIKLLEGPLPLGSYENAAAGSGLETSHPSVEKTARLLFTLENYQYDDLTGLLMRDPFMNKIQSRINDLKTGGNDAQQKHPKSFLIMLDIKGLHEINKLGHHVGNEKIKSLGLFLDKDVILADNGMEASAGRLGGDEFAVIVSYDPDQYTFEAASESVFSRINARMCDDQEFPDLNIGKAVEIGPDSQVIELFKESDPKAPQNVKERISKNAGRFSLLVIGKNRKERRRR